MEWKGVEWNGMERNRVESKWNRMELNRLLKIDARSSQIGVRGQPKSGPEAPRDIQICFWEHVGPQGGLPWPIGVANGTLGGSILALSGLILELLGIILASWEFMLGAPGLHVEGP